MAAGLPVLVSNRCGCAADLVEPGRNGFVFNPFRVEDIAECLARAAAASPKELNAMGARSRSIIETWSPARFGRGVVEATRAANANTGRELEKRAKGMLLTSTSALSSALTPKMRGA
jgi:glycosyltransferase involved in cell wall biosynthesis